MTNKYVEEIMKGVRKLQKGELLLQEDDLEWIIEKQIHKAQLDVLENLDKLVHRCRDTTMLQSTSEGVCKFDNKKYSDGINKLKQEASHD